MASIIHDNKETSKDRNVSLAKSRDRKRESI